MKNLIYPFIFLLSLGTFSQEIHDEFMPTFIGDKEAFLSSKTGEFVYRAHDKTDVAAMYTTESGTVIYEDRKVHVVKKGETLSAIAKKHSISVADVKSQNKLKSSNLSIGQELRVTIKQVVPSSKPVVNKPEGKIIARLAPGQTPGGMTPPDLPPDAMPGSTINLVVEDDTHKLEKKPDVPQVDNVTENISEDGTITHTVKGGETLFMIARKYKVSIDDLKKDNNLALNTLSPGQKLKVKVYNPAVLSSRKAPIAVKPARPHVKDKVEEIQGVVEVEAENNVDEVAEVLEVAEEQVKKEVAVIKKKDDAEVVVEEKQEEANEERTKALIKKYKKKEVAEPKEKSESDKSSIYVVKKGDTLWSIAKRHQISLKDLKELNKLTSSTLSIGQELRVK